MVTSKQVVTVNLGCKLEKTLNQKNWEEYLVVPSQKQVGKAEERALSRWQLSASGSSCIKSICFNFLRRTKKKNCPLLIADTNANYNTQKADTIQKSQLTKTGGQGEEIIKQSSTF